MRQLSERQAYAATYSFLEHLYRLTNSDYLATLLGGMSLLPDGGTADPAIAEEWRAAVDRALAGEVNVALELRPPDPE